ncbi:MAG: APC family permease [Actinobacteria bacterium]|nr:APC family permease [Actinomycetota bacterium]
MTDGSATAVGLKRVKMRMITAVAVMFTLTCSGSFGMEDIIGSSGPGLTMVMLLVLPFLWALPMALTSAELGSALPEEGGFYRWVRRALGEFWGFQAGWWWQLSLYVDTAVYVALTLDYMAGWFDMPGWVRWLIGFGIILIFAYINIRGIDITGWVLTAIQVIVIVPFVTLIILGFAKAQVSPLSPFIAEGETFFGAMGLGLAVAMWMYSGYESMSTLAGEIERPQHVIPRALLINMGIVIPFYVLTTAAGYMAVGEWSSWSTEGGEGAIDFIEAGRAVGGGAVAGMLIAALVAGNLGLFTGYLATGSRPAYVLSKDKLFFRWFGKEHPKYGTPYRSILFMALLNSVLIIGSFSFLIVIDVFLLMFAYMTILTAMIVLRVKEPNLERRFRIPLPTWALIAWFVPFFGIAILALFTNGWAYFVGGCVGVLSGPAAYLIFKSRYHGVELPDTLLVSKDAAGTLPLPTPAAEEV